MSLLAVNDLAKSFFRRRDMFGRSRDAIRAVDGVSFIIEAGETVALVGESGSGKSTTARLVLRILEADRGRIELDGVDVRALGRSKLRAMRRKMQMIFQDPYSSFDPRVPIGDSIGEPLLVHFGTERGRRLQKVAELLERVGMSASDLLRYPRELSGGQLQRAAIARALTLEPRLIVCDECVASLDVSIRAQVLNLMLRLQRDRKISFLFITHDLSLVKAIADRVYVMCAGKILETGAVRSVFESPQHDYTRHLLSAIPSLGLRQAEEVIE